MGLKDGAKALMMKAGVPVVPGYHGERQEPKFLKEKAYEIGYPVLIKAVAGGGGKGMRRVERHADFDAALESAMREANAAFGDGRVLIEKYISAPRHIEIQVFADRHGNVIHLGERDCSLQRRHQKVIEEAPAPGMTAELRDVIGRAAVEAARAVGYVGAGTVEFIAEGTGALRADRFWFMEMNTRLQVEHPVTEAVTGLDLVEWQFRVAAGEPLPLSQDQVRLHGHAVEARLYAEDPDKGFLPSTGRLVALQFPALAGIRVDSGVEAGEVVSPYYDPMIAKIIAHAETREAALDRLAEALDATIVAGPRSNVAFLAALCRAAEFREGRFDTGLIDRHLASLGADRQGVDRGAAARGVARLIEREAERIAARRSRTGRHRRGTSTTHFSCPVRAPCRLPSGQTERISSRKSAMARREWTSSWTVCRRRWIPLPSTGRRRSMSCARDGRPSSGPRMRMSTSSISTATVSSARRCTGSSWPSWSRRAQRSPRDSASPSSRP